jgi:O-antigen chain-terminating methyltransferase
MTSTNALRHKGTVDRWLAIQEELGHHVGSAMDIGCNNGFFTFNLAQLGYVSLGIESERSLYHVCNLVKEINACNSAIFLNAKLEDVITQLPKVDVTVFLSLFHHLVRLHGIDHASEILSQLLSKTNRVMFFEMGQSNEVNTSWARYLPDMGAEPRLWLQDYFANLDVKRVKWLGDFETHLSPVRRSLFALYIN